MIRKLPETPQEERERHWAACRDPDHEPDTSKLEPGKYDHTCDGCGRRRVLTVPPKET